MVSTSGRRLQDAAITVGSFAAIGMGILLVNEEARQTARRAMNGEVDFAGMLPDVRLHTLMRSANDLVGRDHVEVAAFVVAGLVLFLLMFRL